MNSLLWSADRTTHIKIAAVSLAMTAIVAATIGTSTRIDKHNADSAKNYVDHRPVIAGKPIDLSSIANSTIR